MTTAEISAEIFRNLGVLAESENMLPRVAMYLRRLVKEQQADVALNRKNKKPSPCGEGFANSYGLWFML